MVKLEKHIFLFWGAPLSFAVKGRNVFCLDLEHTNLESYQWSYWPWIIRKSLHHQSQWDYHNYKCKKNANNFCTNSLNMLPHSKISSINVMFTFFMNKIHTACTPLTQKFELKINTSPSYFFLSTSCKN